LAPPVRIEGMIADGHEMGYTGRVSVPAKTSAIHIEYTGLSFVAPRKVKFRYKLEGYDKDWSPPVSLREVSYTNLPPGSYQFRVIASNNDGVWNKEGAKLDFYIAPAWYQTIWFRILCLVCASVIAWCFYRIRVRQIASAMSARFDERLAERTRIAREMHDTLLQTIQGSKLVANNALKNADDPVRMRRALEQLAGWLVRATEEGRVALQSLRRSTTETNELAAGMQRALDECQENSSVEGALQVAGEPREIHPIVRDEIYLIGYEAIRNAYAHSRGSRLDVELSYGENITLVVRDNGVGIDSAIADVGRNGHFGLLTMRERSARIGARLTIGPAARSGTEVNLVIPGRIAFRGPRPSPLDKVKTILGRATKSKSVSDSLP
jgi:signal transduction histidine kinase